MGTRKRELALVGGPAPHKREAKAGDWTEEKESAFVEALAETCNVTLSAKRAGVGNTTVYTRRRRDAAFRVAWSEALAQGYARLEIETLERAINGTMRTIVRKDGSEQESVEHDPRTALSLLRLHRENAREPERRQERAAAISDAEAWDARNSILMKLKKIRVQLLGKEAGEAGGWGAIGPDEPPLPLSRMDDTTGAGEPGE